MEANFWFSAAAMAGPLRSRELRSSNGVKQKKTMPALGATLKPLMLNPGKATALCTPGCLRPISVMRRITASERSREAASGSWAKATRYCLSWVGTKPVGTLLKLHPVRKTSPAQSSSATALLRKTAPTPLEYFSPDQADVQVEGRETEPMAW